MSARLSRGSVLVVVAALVCSAGLVWQASSAAFTASTRNDGSALSAGTVVLTDDDAGSALFSLAGMAPGDAASRCITVSYSGSLPAQVRVFAASGGSGLAAHLEVVVTRGWFAGPPGGGSCAGFTADATDYDGDGAGVVFAGALSGLPVDWASGRVDPSVSGSPTAELWTAGEEHAYRVAVSLPSGVGDAAQGLTATTEVFWEARDAAGSYEAAVLGDSPVGYWRLNDVPGLTTADALGAQAGSYMVDASRRGAPGAVDGDGYLDLTSTAPHPHVVLPRLVTDDMSVEFWFNSREGFGENSQWWENAGLVDADVSGQTDDWGVSLRADGRITAGVAEPSVTVSSGPGYDDGAWHHVVFTRQRSTGALRLYVDGTQVASGTGHTRALSAATTVTVGRSQWSAELVYTGSIDEVAVYPSVLTAGQVAAHRAAGSGSSYASAVLADAPAGYWRLGETSGTTAVDEVTGGAGRDGTYTGTTAAASTTTGTTGDGDGAFMTGRQGAVLPRLVSDDFSLELWFMGSGFGAASYWWQNAGLLDGDTTNALGNDFGISLTADGRVRAGTGGSARPDLESPPGLDDGAWHHVVLTRSRASGALRLYVDGALVDSDTASTASLVGSPRLTVGFNQSGYQWSGTAGLPGQRRFVGRIDDVAQYAYVLSDAQVRAHFEAAS